MKFYKYKWVIEKFSTKFNPTDNDEYFKSDRIPIPNSILDVVYEIHTCGENDPFVYYSLSIYCHTSARFRFQYKCAVQDEHGKWIAAIEDNIFIEDGDIGYKGNFPMNLRKLLTRSSFSDSQKYCPGDKLTLQFEVSYCTDLLYKKILDGKINEDQNYHKKQSLKILESGKFSDVVFVFDNGEEIPAHKAILSAGYSPVFSAMLENEEPMESQTIRVKIDGIKKEIFYSLLRFIYTGEPMVMDFCANELLIAADKYQVYKLKYYCEDALCSILDDDNAFELNKLAKMVNADKLKDKAFNLLKKQMLQNFLNEDPSEKIVEMVESWGEEEQSAKKKRKN